MAEYHVLRWRGINRGRISDSSGRSQNEFSNIICHFELRVQVVTAGTGCCFPRENPFLDTFCDFQRVFPTETQKVFRKEKSEKHVMCFSYVSHRYFFCFSQDLPFRNSPETQYVFLASFKKKYGIEEIEWRGGVR